MAGKGSRPRPILIPREEFDNKFETIFGKPKERKQVVIDVPPLEQKPKAKPKFGSLDKPADSD